MAAPALVTHQPLLLSRLMSRRTYNTLVQVANGKDSAAQVRQLQQDNKHLRSQLEQQYNQVVKMAETIQMVHLVRIKDSVKDSETSGFKVCQPLYQAGVPSACVQPANLHCCITGGPR